MKHSDIKLFFLIVFLLIITFQLSYSQEDSWISIGPEGGLIADISTSSINSNIVYAITRHGSIFKSNDSGENWLSIGWFDGTGRIIKVHPSDPNIVYAGFSSINGLSSLLKSTNGGLDWSTTGWGNEGVINLLIDPQNPMRIYLSSFKSSGLYGTDNGGNSWELLSKPDESGFLFALEIDPQNNNIIYAASNSGKVYRSTDSGLNWGLKVNIDGSSQCLDIDPQNTNILYLSTSEGVFKSNDSGVSWVEKNGGDINKDHPWTEDILVNTANPNRIYRSNNHNWTTFISKNSGENWIKTNMPAGAFTIAGDTTFLTGTRDGIFSSNLKCENVKNSSSNLNGLNIKSLQVVSSDNSKIYVVTEDQGIATANLYISKNRPISWEKQFFGRGVSEIKIHPSNPEIILGGFNGGQNGINISSDGGNSWIVRGPNDHIFSLEFDQNNQSKIYAGGMNGFYCSDNLWKYWEKINIPSGYHSINDISISTIQKTIFLALEYGWDWSRRKTLIYSTDNCQSWFDTNIPAQTIFIHPINPNIILVGTSNKLFRSVDSGFNWDEISFYSGEVSVNCFNFLRDNIILMGTNNGIFYSSNNGNTWLDLKKGLIHKNVICLASIIKPEPMIFAGTIGGSINRIKINSLTNIKNFDHWDNCIVLYDNYPNPFNSETNIRFTIPNHNHIILKIYNLRGEEVRTLINKNMTPGTHNVKFSGYGLTSGVYFYKLMSGGFSKINKFLKLN